MPAAEGLGPGNPAEDRVRGNICDPPCPGCRPGPVDSYARLCGRCQLDIVKVLDVRFFAASYLVVYPPLAKMVWPVIHQPSVTKNSTKGAMSLMSVSPPNAEADLW